MKKLAVAFILCIAFFGCGKEKDNGGPVVLGTVDFYNNSIYPFQIYVDGVSHGSMLGMTEAEVRNIPVGKHTVRALQQSGFIAFPIDQSMKVQVIVDSAVKFAFP